MSKRYIYLLMFLSFLPLFIFFRYPENTDLPWESFVIVVARLIGLMSAVFLFWQLMLGFRGITGKLTDDVIWTNALHQRLGKYAYLFIIFHPTFMILGYLERGVDYLGFNLDGRYNQYVALGKLAFTILTLIWVSSALLRSKLKYRPWKFLHFLAYPIFPMVVFHSLNVGDTLLNTNLKYYWYILLTIYLLVFIYRLFFQLGFTKYSYKVSAVEKVAQDVSKITFKPTGSFIKPKPGQFMYIQLSLFGENHPYTISHYNEQTNEISISPKVFGKFSAKLQSIKVGDPIFIDGPYGVFTKEVYTTENSIVMVAGGIGITPYLRTIENLAKVRSHNVILFYCGNDYSTLAYTNEINIAEENNPKFKVIYVCKNKVADTNLKLEEGQFSIDILKKHLVNLENTDFFVCGPPGMNKAILKELNAENISRERIFTEKFAI